MSDRELLELAAKAAGYEVKWAEWVTSRLAEFGCVKHIKHQGYRIDGREWNPLADDGDALRLAISLGMCVNVGRRPVEFSEASVIIDDERVSAEEYHDADPCAATRRAIVRAAAEIGKGME